MLISLFPRIHCDVAFLLISVLQDQLGLALLLLKKFFNLIVVLRVDERARKDLVVVREHLLHFFQRDPKQIVI